MSATTIYHRDAGTGFGLAVKLNLKAVRELLDREVPHFSDLTPADKKLLQRRFAVYCKHGRADFGIGAVAGKFQQEHPPSIDNLPNKAAVQVAIAKVKGGAK